MTYDAFGWWDVKPYSTSTFLTLISKVYSFTFSRLRNNYFQKVVIAFVKTEYVAI